MKTEDLLTLYKRAMQYCVAAYGSEPDRIQIEDYGGLSAMWYARHCGGDDEFKYFSVEKLTSDLDELYRERMRKEEEARQEALKQNEIRKKIREEQDKEDRKATYLKLKQEFGE